MKRHINVETYKYKGKYKCADRLMQRQTYGQTNNDSDCQMYRTTAGQTGYWVD